MTADNRTGHEQVLPILVNNETLILSVSDKVDIERIKTLRNHSLILEYAGLTMRPTQEDAAYFEAVRSLENDADRQKVVPPPNIVRIRELDKALHEEGWTKDERFEALRTLESEAILNVSRGQSNRPS